MNAHGFGLAAGGTLQAGLLEFKDFDQFMELAIAEAGSRR